MVYIYMVRIVCHIFVVVVFDDGDERRNSDFTQKDLCLGKNKKKTKKT